MNKEILRSGGIDYDNGVYRFAGQAGIYEKYLLKFFGTGELPALRESIEDEDYDSAFRIAHNIKGTAGNLSITLYYEKICEIVEALRAGVRDDSLLTMCSEAETLYDAAYKAVKEATNGSEN